MSHTSYATPNTTHRESSITNADFSTVDEKRIKICFVMIDGIGEVNSKHLDGKTALQSAHTPNMDLLAKTGMNGLMDPVQPGLACGSDTAHMSIFGYEPRLHYKGRGSFETIGAGLDMNPGDIAFKSNFATWNAQTNIVELRRADRHFEDIGPILCDYIEKRCEEGGFNAKHDCVVSVKYATEHRCGVKVSGKNLSGDITGTDPLVDNLALVKCEPVKGLKGKELENAKRTSDLVNDLSYFIYEQLVQHDINKQRKKERKNEANIVLLRGCGVCIDVPPFSVRHPGLRSVMVAPTAIIAGLGKSIGMDLKKVEGATGDYRTDLIKKGSGFLKYLLGEDEPGNENKYNFGFCHIKAVDDTGHDGNYNLKKEFIEKSDLMIGMLMQEFEKRKQRAVFIVTGDHTTPCYYLDHSFEPVPLIISANYLNLEKHPELADTVQTFDEVYSKGGLGRFTGKQVFDIIREYINITTSQEDFFKF
ncbi:hypothetical protein FDP41_011744 [Naegleria fowleri]|uniref:Metalloenzyme domain-containing protein n=1 Tax=Naegleria fowleri TaxID=5763 RepID=A0A6A5BUX4_NAEFO|nr:uncharacterized protein FDP41_011744 [Naegleria fowleri]KAF0981883.1 hypothetical protein FDP41_011744 [Naegleria fowleri]CAG4718677.1 unnamed protein product [Naegleria fowleri]